MDLSVLKIYFLTFLVSYICSVLARDFSIVGYSAEHLTSVYKLVELFELWVSRHGKASDSLDERLHGFEVFRVNLKHIDHRNKKITSYWLGLNELADLSHEEFKSKYFGFLGRKALKTSVIEMSWTRPNLLTGEIAAVESINQIVTGNLTSLSEQQLVDCDTSFNNGCNGGLMDYAFEFIVSNGGLHKEEDYPYLMEEARKALVT
ncbi:hypothetical protein NC652_023380 [Populus alba x Populus x berolinensis]|nr:hypothetical protein NC652_023380 [Populus alba x Populus x berolinensis]